MEIKEFTEKEYFKAIKLYPNIGIKRLEEEGEEYYTETEDEYEVHQEHDKLFKKITERPREIEAVIKWALKLKKNEKLDIISVRNELITVDFRGKQVDILYKLRDREVYFLIEHQSTRDPNMAFRILEYEVEIMDRAFEEKEFKSKFQAKVIAIVIYTGPGEWKEPQSIVEVQEKFGYKVKPDENYVGIGEYNVLSIHDFTKEELLEEGTFLARAMLLEKVRGEEELIEVLDKIIPMTKEDERRDMIDILRYILVKDLGKERAQKYIEMLEEGGISMGTFVNELRADRERTILKAKEDGEKMGRKEGRKEGRKGIIKMLFKNNMTAEEISEKTGIKLAEILKIVK